MTAEIVAKRFERSVWHEILVVLIFVVLLVFFILLAVSSFLVANYVVSVIDIIFAALILLAIVFCVCESIFYHKTPEILITYEDGKFNFADVFFCDTTDVINITSKHMRGRYLIQLSCGKIIIDLKDKQIKLNYVENIDKVVFRLNEYIKSNHTN